MAAPGRFHGVVFGADLLMVQNGAGPAPTLYAMAALNTGWAARFTAPDARNVKTVYVNWATVSAPGTVQLRVETIDATTGKPSGTPYDANAVLNITPSTGGTLGWQACTFAVLPTAGLVAGNEYALVLLTTVAGTTMTLRGHLPSQGDLPAVALTAADGTTRANFAEVNNTAPVATVVFEDNVEERCGMAPWTGAIAYAFYAARASALKFVVPAGVVLTVAGANVGAPARTGSPGNLRVRIFTSSDAAVAGAAATVDKDSLVSLAARNTRVFFPAPVALPAGTYRLVFDQTDRATTGSNSYSLRSAPARTAALNPSGLVMSTTLDLDAGTITWTDAAAEQPIAGLILDDVTAAAAATTYLILQS